MSENAKQLFAENLKRILSAQGRTQQELALYMGCSSSTVSDWCSGKKYPRIDKMERMADYLHTTLTELTANPAPDPLQEVDIAFYGEYRELDERDKETLRDMVRVMRQRRAARQEE